MLEEIAFVKMVVNLYLNVIKKYPKVIFITLLVLLVVLPLHTIWLVWQPENRTPIEFACGYFQENPNFNESLNSNMLYDLGNLKVQLASFLSRPSKEKTLANFLQDVDRLFKIKNPAKVDTRKQITIGTNILFLFLIIWILLHNRTDIKKIDSLSTPAEINCLSRKEAGKWLHDKWKKAGEVKIVSNKESCVDINNAEFDLLSALNNESKILLNSNAHQSLKNSGIPFGEWGNWPLSHILTDSLQGTTLRLHGFSIIKEGGIEKVLYTKRLQKPKKDEAGNSTGNIECIENSTYEESDSNHPGANIASCLFYILNDLYSNIAEPLRKILGTYLATVNNRDENIANVAIVRVIEWGSGHGQSDKPPGALIYEGMAIKHDNSVTKAIYWQTKALCVDLFALPVDKYPPFILFRSEPKQIVVFKDKKARLDSNETISNFGELKVAQEKIYDKKTIIQGHFWDIGPANRFPNEESNRVIEREVRLQPIKEAVRENIKIENIKTKVNQLWEKAQQYHWTLSNNEKFDESSATPDSQSEQDSNFVNAPDFCDELEELISDTNIWKGEAVHLQYFQ